MGQRVLVSRQVSEAKVGAAAGAAAASLQALQLASSAEATRRPFCSGRSVLAARADPAPVLCIPPFPALSGPCLAPSCVVDLFLLVPMAFRHA